MNNYQCKETETSRNQSRDQGDRLLLTPPCFETESIFVVKAGLKLLILLPLPPGHWDYRYTPWCLAGSCFFSCLRSKLLNLVLHLQEIANKLGLNISYDALNDEYICLLSAAMVSPGGWAVLPAWASLSSPWLSHIYVSESKPWSGGVFWCSLRQGTPGFNSTPGAPWAAGHRTWLFRKGWITTGSGAMKDSVLSAWFFKEEIRTKSLGSH